MPVALKKNDFFTKTFLDPDLSEAIQREGQRQADHLELIASENIVSKAVLEAQGSVLTNKYAEGFVGKRYYGGCEFIDDVEKLATERVCKLFGCEFANVQPHSGSSANLAVFFALLSPGDTYMALSLDQGGHLTHGSPVNFSGKWFNVVPYGLNRDEYIDMEAVRATALECRPKMIIAGLTAYSRPLDFKTFREIADEVGALLLVDMAHIAGLIATGLHDSPFPHAHVVTSTTHKTLRGPRGGIILTNEATLAKRIDSAVFPGLQGGPLMHVIAAKAAAFYEALQPSFKAYMHQVVQNSRALAKTLQDGGLRLVSGGSDNHMMIVDLTALDISGAQAEEALEKAGVVCNKNTIPNDQRPPREGSGIRLGTPACTTRGMKEKDFEGLGKLIIAILKAQASQKLEDVLPAFRQEVRALATSYPLPY